MRDRQITVFKTVLVLLIIVFLLFPWPKQDYIIHGFDPHLIKFDPAGFRSLNGSITVVDNGLILRAFPGSQPTLYVGGQHFPVQYEFDFRVLKSGINGLPIVIRIFNLQSWIGVCTDESGRMFVNTGSENIEGVSEELNISLNLSKTYNVQLNLLGHMESTLAISGEGLKATKHFSPEELFGADPHSLPTQTFVAIIVDAAVEGAEQVLLLTNFRVVIPSNSSANYNLAWAGRVSAICLLLTIVISTMVSLRGQKLWRRAQILSITFGFWKLLFIIALFTALVLINVFLGTFGGHPFDIFSFSTWSYIASKYGPEGIYPVSNIVPNVVSYGQHPYAVGLFSYPPGAFYFFYLIGIIGRNFSETGFGLSTLSYGSILRMLNMVCIIIAAIMAYFAVRKMGLRSSLCWATFMLFILNPPLLLDSFMWGETEALLIVVLMFSALAYHYGRFSLATFGAILAITIKQPAVIPSLIMLFLIVKALGLRRFLKILGEALMLLFVFLAPLFISGLHPMSIPDQTIYHVFRVQFGSDPFESVISIDGAHNFPLVFSSIYSPSAPYSQSDLDPTSFFGLSWRTICLVLFFAYIVILILLIALSEKERIKTHDVAYEVLACASLAVPFLLTRAVSRRFVVPSFFLPLIQFRRRRVAILTLLLWISSSISIINSLGVEGMLRPQVVPRLAPQNNTLIKFFMELNANPIVSFILSLFNLGILTTITFKFISSYSDYHVIRRIRATFSGYRRRFKIYAK